MSKPMVVLILLAALGAIALVIWYIPEQQRQRTQEIDGMIAQSTMETYAKTGRPRTWRERELFDSAQAAYARHDYARVERLLRPPLDSAGCATSADIIRLDIENGDASPRERRLAKLPRHAFCDTVRADNAARIKAMTPP